MKNLEILTDESSELLKSTLAIANRRIWACKVSDDKTSCTLTDKKTRKKIFNLKINNKKFINLLECAYTNKETPFDVKIVAKPEEYVYLLDFDTMEDKCSKSTLFTFSVANIKRIKVIRVYGETYGLTGITYVDAIEPTKLNFLRNIPQELCFKNLEDAIKVCEILKDKTIRSLNDFVDICKEYIKYDYKGSFGYYFNSEVDVDICDKNCKKDLATKVYKLKYDTNVEYRDGFDIYREGTALGYTIGDTVILNPIDYLKDLTDFRVDSVGDGYINISHQGRTVELINNTVNVAFSIIGINDTPEF